MDRSGRHCKGVQKSAEGIQIFTDGGEISAEIVDNFFGRYNLTNHEKNLNDTNKFLRTVVEFDLLVGVKFIIGRTRLPSGRFQDNFFHFLMISEKKLAALDRESMMRLQTAGYVNVINAHLKSLSNFRQLIRAVTLSENSKPQINMSNFTFGS